MSDNLYNAGEQGKVDWGTPSWVTSPIFDRWLTSRVLDPFSSALANTYVGADYYYSEEDDGFSTPWFGDVWLNHPFSASTNKRFPHKLWDELLAGNIRRFAGICFTTAMGTEWFDLLTKACSHFILLPTRVAYRDLSTGIVETAPRKPSLIYLGTAEDSSGYRFDIIDDDVLMTARQFEKMGVECTLLVNESVYLYGPFIQRGIHGDPRERGT